MHVLVVLASVLTLAASAMGQANSNPTAAGGEVAAPLVATSTSVVPWSVAVDHADNVYMSSNPPGSRIHVVFKLDRKGNLTRVAGIFDERGPRGDGGPATRAYLSEPEGLAVDPKGNLYFADGDSVRMVALDGKISTVAGTGKPGYSGDGGPATSAQLNRPDGLAIDASGNLYIADAENHRIRKVTSDGTISTVAGNGTEGYSGDGGPATGAQLGRPDGVALDSSGNLYISDHNNSRVRKVARGGVISTVVGKERGSSFGCGELPTGDGGPAKSAQLCWPEGVAVDTRGNLYIAGSERIRKVTPGGTISTVAGTGANGYSGDGGPATKAQLSSSRSVAVDSAGNVYIADWYNQRLRKVTPDGTISTVAGNGTGTPGILMVR